MDAKYTSVGFSGMGEGVKYDRVILEHLLNMSILIFIHSKHCQLDSSAFSKKINKVMKSILITKA